MLQKINENNYKKILPWRNQELVRKNSLDSKIISEDEHDSWWKNVKEDSSKSWLIYKEENIECGVVSFHSINDESAYWGFYFAEDKLFSENNISKLKAWKKIEEEAITHAKEILKLKYLFCEILETNKSVIRMHLKFGFKTYSTKNNIHLMKIKF